MTTILQQAWVRLGVLLAGILLVWGTSGCASTQDAENLSERPWNAPRSWEHGLPSGMFEGR